MRAGAVNLATFANALCHLNATPLSVVLAPCAWGVWLRGNAQHNSLASVAKWAVLVGKAKMEQCLGWGGGLLSLSLSHCSHFWQAFAFNLKKTFRTLKF